MVGELRAGLGVRPAPRLYFENNGGTKMAAFASDRRSGWVRVLVLILCALFIFGCIAAPPAYAISETVALFGAAAVLSAATAALGFKLSTDSEGRATLSKMVEDFAKVSWATGLVIVGTKLNGLIDGMNYIRMQVKNGKTYLDERVVAWVQQWLGENGVYDTGGVSYPSDTYNTTDYFPFYGSSLVSVVSGVSSNMPSSVGVNLLSQVQEMLFTYSVDLTGKLFSLYVTYNVSSASFDWSLYVANSFRTPSLLYNNTSSGGGFYLNQTVYCSVYYPNEGLVNSSVSSSIYLTPDRRNSNSTYIRSRLSNYGEIILTVNDTGLSGTDTIGEDYKDKTLEQILAGLKEWAQDWYDAGADSATNSTTGAVDLPLTMSEGAATENPAANPAGVYNPPFTLPWPDVRSGETSSSTTEAGQANAAAAETTTADVAENQTVIDSLVNWALGYISPDTGLFSKFPLCVPYDAYLLACSALGVDVVQSDSIFGASPGDLSGVVQTGSDEQGEGFTPVISISNDLTVDGYTYPIDITIDLTDWTPLFKFTRLAISITVIAELIGAEYRRIKGH